MTILTGIIQQESGWGKLKTPFDIYSKRINTTTLSDTEEKEKIREKVSKYAITNGAEFLAEYITGRM